MAGCAAGQPEVASLALGVTPYTYVTSEGGRTSCWACMHAEHHPDHFCWHNMQTQACAQTCVFYALTACPWACMQLHTADEEGCLGPRWPPPLGTLLQDKPELPTAPQHHRRQQQQQLPLAGRWLWKDRSLGHQLLLHPASTLLRWCCTSRTRSAGWQKRQQQQQLPLALGCGLARAGSCGLQAGHFLWHSACC